MLLRRSSQRTSNVHSGEPSTWQATCETLAGGSPDSAGACASSPIE